MAQPPSLLSRLVYRAAGPLGATLSGLSRLVAGTSRMEIVGEERVPAGPVIYVHWHKHIPLLMKHHGDRGRYFLISGAPLLEPMARWGTNLGLRVLRGASGEGGREIRERLAERLRQGRSIALAVDGPAGPVFQVKPGCVELAQALGVPIVPLSYRCSLSLPLPFRWDEMVVPLPGGRVVLTYGAPLRVAATDDAATALEAVRRALDELDDR